MTRSFFTFLGIIILNTLIAIGYLLWNLLFKKAENHRLQYVMHTMIMVICPIVGGLYFLLTYLKYRFLKLGERDLSDVEFSKQRCTSRIKADEERERNIVAVEEAILVSDQEKKRANMLNILLCETEESFSAIAQALNSDDSEVAHYAASFLQSKMDGFRDYVRKTQKTLLAQDIQQEDCQEQILELIRYMNQMLKQNVFVRIEQNEYVVQMEQLCELLYQNAKSKLSPECYEWIMYRTMELSEHEKAELWGKRFYEQYPEQLSAYRLRLKLYFETSQKELFFEVLRQLRNSSVVVDNQTLQLIRMFQRSVG